MKKITFTLLCLVLCFSMAFGVFAEGVKITVDGTEVKQVDANGDAVPDSGDAELVPLRAVLKAMGYFVDYVDGQAVGGAKANPSIKLTPGEDGSVLIDGTTFIPYSDLADPSGAEYDSAYSVEKTDDEIAYTNTYTEMTNGYYLISLDGKYLTGETLPAEDKVETVTNEDGTTEEKVTTPQNQIRATNVVLEDKIADADTQLWLVKELSNHKYAIINKHNGLALDVNSWSQDNAAPIIQYTLAGGTNQQWVFVPCESTTGTFYITSIHSRLPLTVVGEDEYETGLAENAVIQAVSDDANGFAWQLELVSEYTNPVDLVPETEAFKELDSLYQERFDTYFNTDVDFSRGARDKAETFLRESGFEDADKETQKELIRECLDITYSDLLGGWMREKLTANYEIASVTRTSDTNPEVLEDEDAKNYYVYTINMECTGPDDIHTFTVETVDENDEEHVRKVCDAVACFEPPVRKTLRHFYYTGDKFGTWNAWDGEVWNNTGSKFDVDGMLTMFAHELGHVIDSDFKCGDDVWRRAINQDIIPTSGYGKTNRWEDFGEFSRLYLMSRGDDDRIAAIAKIYPHRTETYRAALYNIDNDYYSEYKDCYDKVTAAIGDTTAIDDQQYYTVEGANGALTNNNGVLSTEENTKADNQLWQLYKVDDRLVKLYCKADGMALVIPSININEEAVASTDNATTLGVMTDANGASVLTVSETGYKLSESDGKIVASATGEGWTLTPVEKIEGLGSFTIKSGDKYLVPSTEERGAQLVLSSEKSELAVWNVTKLPNGVGYLTNAANDFAIDISGASEEEGAKALTYTLSRNSNQMWLIEENENGTVSFKAQHSGLYLALDENSEAVQSSEKFEWTMEKAE